MCYYPAGTILCSVLHLFLFMGSFVLGLNHVRKKTLYATTELKQVELEVKDLMEKKAALLEMRNTTQE